jgi:hypothetical protein
VASGRITLNYAPFWVLSKVMSCARTCTLALVLEDSLMIDSTDFPPVGNANATSFIQSV